MAKPTARKQIGEAVNDGADNERRKYVDAARRDSSRRDPGISAKSVVYGEYPDEQLLFIPEPRARFLAPGVAGHAPIRDMG